MKKIISLLAIIMMVAICPQSLWADEWAEVSTAQAFYDAIQDNHSSNIRLTADVDISSLTTQDGYVFKFDGGFKGKIDGQGYALKNSTHPLFYHINGAEISNIVLDGFHVTNVTSVLARTSAKSAFSNITVKNSSITDNTSDSRTNFGMIAGYSENDIFEYCTVDRKCSIIAKHDRVGGIVGYSIKGCFFSYCHNAAYIWSSGNNVGGIIGVTDTSKGEDNERGIIQYCLNTGNIYGDGSVAGIVGYACSSSDNKFDIS